MASQQSSDDEPITAINVTPLVDVTLVLLIIFMVTASLIVNPQMKVNLPKASNAETGAQSPIGILISADGGMMLNDKIYTEADLRAKLAEIKKQRPDVRALISADKYAFHGTVIHALDLVKGAGIDKFAFEIEAQ